jgi:hypothetical protein
MPQISSAVTPPRVNVRRRRGSRPTFCYCLAMIQRGAACEKMRSKWSIDAKQKGARQSRGALSIAIVVKRRAHRRPLQHLDIAIGIS